MNDSTYQILRLIVYLIGVPIIVALMIRIVLRVRAIRALDARLKAEEAARPTDPYAAMAAIALKSRMPERSPGKSQGESAESARGRDESDGGER